MTAAIKQDNGGHFSRALFIEKCEIPYSKVTCTIIATPEVVEPKWQTPERSMCTRLRLGHNFRQKY